MKNPEINLSFINHALLRHKIERDLAELDKAYQARLVKSTLVLSGSIVEAILLNYMLEHVEKKDIPQGLFHLIKKAFELKIINKSTVELATVINEYRNLIHPEREIRLQEDMNEHYADISYHVLKVIIGDIQKNYESRNQYTAQSVIDKILYDPDSQIIFSSILLKMTQGEIDKLFKEIPAFCYAEKEKTQSSLKGFTVMYALLKDSVTEKTLENERNRFLEILHKAGRSDILYFARFFIFLIDSMNESEKKQTVDYLISCASNHNPNELDLFYNIDFSLIAKYLSEENMNLFFENFERGLNSAPFNNDKFEKYSFEEEIIVLSHKIASQCPNLRDFMNKKLEKHPNERFSRLADNFSIF